MDTTDKTIFFDASGVCNHCLRYEELKRQSNPAAGEFSQLVEQIKRRGKKYPYDCIAAVSGGTDSSFMLHQLKESGLRILVVHYDSGWNTEEAVHNLAVLTDRMGLELYTTGVEAEEFRDVQLAYLNAGVVDLDVPTDHALYGSLFRAAVLKKAPYILTGHNMATESVMPVSWVTDKLDSRNLLDIYHKFGSGRKLKSFPLQTPWTKFVNYNLRRIQLIFVLNYLDYDKEKASGLLEDEYGWAPVRVKHGESVWTRFYQCYILPERHQIDKRKAHYSNLILSNVMTREAAIGELKLPVYKDDFEADRQLIMERYRITEEMFAMYMNGPLRQHSDFRSEQSLKRFYNCMRNLPLLKALLRISTRHNTNA